MMSIIINLIPLAQIMTERPFEAMLIAQAMLYSLGLIKDPQE